jgi:hypothetical protein
MENPLILLLGGSATGKTTFLETYEKERPLIARGPREADYHFLNCRIIAVNNVWQAAALKPDAVLFFQRLEQTTFNTYVELKNVYRDVKVRFGIKTRMGGDDMVMGGSVEDGFFIINPTIGEHVAAVVRQVLKAIQ